MTTRLICETLGIIDEYQSIQDRKAAESMSRYNAAVSPDSNIGKTADTEEIIEDAEEVKGSRLNGVQTQSLLTVVGQYAAGALTENQAANIIVATIGISKEEAKGILRGD